MVPRTTGVDQGWLPHGVTGPGRFRKDTRVYEPTEEQSRLMKGKISKKMAGILRDPKKTLRLVKIAEGSGKGTMLIDGKVYKVQCK